MAAILDFLHLNEITRRRELLLLIGLGIVEGFSWTLVKPMLPLFASELGATEFMVGIIVAVPPLIQIFTRIPSGAAAVRYGKRRMILLSFIMTIVGAAALTLARSVSLIFPAQICLAIGESLFWPANWAYITSLAPRPKQGTVVALVMGIQGVAGMLMPYLGGRIFDRFGFWLNGLIYTTFIVVGLFIAIRLPKDELASEAEAVAATVQPNGHGQAQQVTPHAKPGLAATRALLAREPILYAAFAGMVIHFSWGINSAFYSLHVTEGLGFTATTVGILMTCQSAFNTMTRFVFARIAHQVKTERIMSVALFVNTVPLMLLPWMRTLPLLFVVAALTGLASGIIPIATKTLYANSTDNRERSLAMGIDGVSMNLGSLVSPIAAGAAATVIGVPATFFAGNLLTIIALVFSRSLIRNRRLVRALSGHDLDAVPEVATA